MSIIPISSLPVLRCPKCMSVLDGAPVIFWCPKGDGSVQGSNAVIAGGRTE
jgi:hypothetical protein